MTQRKVTQQDVTQLLKETVEACAQLAKALEARERRLRQREQQLGLTNADTTKTTSTQPDTLTVMTHINDIHKAVVQYAQLGYRLDADEPSPMNEYYRKLTFVRDNNMQLKTTIPNPFQR
jgi:hypothetical protein